MGDVGVKGFFKKGFHAFKLLSDRQQVVMQNLWFTTLQTV